ncbi:hypothetical protein BX070DRAFT_229630 [Coemansia spiralis]|nr:hypothetical protein BX070DRAFT_229630 [Coemansia spiralis]
MLPILYHNITRRDLPLGPVDPSVVMAQYFAAIGKYTWKLNLALGIAGSTSGLMAVFLMAVFFWRRSLVNRISLRLIFAISVCDFLQCLVQALHGKVSGLSACQAGKFFTYFFTMSSIYLSSSIAFNLQMTFHRKSRSPLPRYVEYLYYIVPFSIALIQYSVEIIISAANGLCDLADPVLPGTTQYIIFAVFYVMLVPTIIILYNIIASVLVIITLYRKQRAISKALSAVSQETRGLLGIKSNGPNLKPLGSMTKKEEKQLRTARIVYRACIRIALYPIAPLIWLVVFIIFFVIQYFITMTYEKDVQRLVRVGVLNWFTYPVLPAANFLVFASDPIVLNVFREVRSTIRNEIVRRRTGFDASSAIIHSSYTGLGKKPSMAASESYDSGMTYDDTSSADASQTEKVAFGDYSLPNGSGALEDGESYSTAVPELYNDSVIRRIRADGDASSFMDSV